jgi:hypothetical protein
MIMRKRLAEIQDQIPRLCALADAKSQKLNRFVFDQTRLPLWAQRSLLGDDSDMQSFSSTKTAPRFRGAWSPYFDAIAAMHNALLQVAPKRCVMLEFENVSVCFSCSFFFFSCFPMILFLVRLATGR